MEIPGGLALVAIAWIVVLISNRRKRRAETTTLAESDRLLAESRAADQQRLDARRALLGRLAGDMRQAAERSA